MPAKSPYVAPDLPDFNFISPPMNQQIKRSPFMNPYLGTKPGLLNGSEMKDVNLQIEANALKGADFAKIDINPAPDMMGKWVQGVGMVKDVAAIGLGIYGAMEQSKMNKFMRSYYGDTMARDNLDFDNAAKDARRQLSDQSERVASARGMAIGSQANQDFTSNRMNEWGASTLA